MLTGFRICLWIASLPHKNLLLVTTFSFLALNYFSCISFGICFHGFASDFAFTVTVNVKVSEPLASLNIHKIVFKIYSSIPKLLLRDEIVVQSSQLILTQLSTCKWVHFWINLQAGASNFTTNVFLQVILKDFAKLWVNSHKHVLYQSRI